MCQSSGAAHEINHWLMTDERMLGDGPARAVNEGTIQRGASSKLDAAVMFSDLRGFTAKSEQWGETALPSALNIASRVQDLCKELDMPVLATASVADCLSDGVVSYGRHPIRGVDQPVEVFGFQ